MTRHWIWLLIFALAGFVGAAEQNRYPVRLFRPDKVGDQYELSISGALRMQMVTSTDGRERPPSEQMFGVELDALAEVRKVDERGSPLEMVFTVRRCRKLLENGERELLAPGKQFTARAKGVDTEFALTDGKITPEQEQALDAVISLREGGPTADELYGTDQPQTIGANWPMNAKVLVVDAKRHDLSYAEEAVAGAATLAGVEKVDGIECLRIESELKVSDFRMKLPPEWNLPPGVTVRSATMEGSSTELVPVDPSLPILGETFSHTTNAVFGGRVGVPARELTVKYRFDRAVQTRLKPVKPPR